MFCPKCNYRPDDEYRWCPKCGTVLQEETSADPNSLEAAMKMQSPEVENRRRKAYADAVMDEKIKKDLNGMGFGSLCMALFHFLGFIWSLLYFFTGELEMDSFSEGSFGEYGRVIIYNSGNYLHSTNPTLTWVEVLMGIAFVFLAMISFTQSSSWQSRRKANYSTVPTMLLFMYLGYTVGLIISYTQIDSGSFYEELFAGTYILYIFVAAIVTLVSFFNYKRKHEEWQYYVITESKGSASRPSANYVSTPSTPSAKPAAQKTTTQNVAQTVKPTEKRNTLKCPVCGEGGQPINRNRCWKCGAKFIK